MRAQWRPRLDLLLEELRKGPAILRLSYVAAENRASRVPVRIRHALGSTTVYVDQRNPPELKGLFTTLGTFEFVPTQPVVITIGNADTDNDGLLDGTEIGLTAPQGLDTDRRIVATDMGA